MKKFLISIAIIIASISIVLGTTIALEIQFIKEMIVRQIIIYLLIILELVITIRIIFLINNNQQNE